MTIPTPTGMKVESAATIGFPRNPSEILPDWNLLKQSGETFLQVAEISWIEDHIINGALIYLAAEMLVMAIEAASQIADPN